MVVVVVVVVIIATKFMITRNNKQENIYSFFLQKQENIPNIILHAYDFFCTRDIRRRK